MKKIKLTEDMLTRIVKRVIEEENIKADSELLGDLIKKLQANPNDEETKNSLKNAVAQKKHYERTQLESLVQRYPNDYGYRFELGVNLFENADYDNCLSHFQLAQRNAKVRLDAILYLGRAYSRKNFYDLAIEQFTLLKNEIQIMDERKIAIRDRGRTLRKLINSRYEQRRTVGLVVVKIEGQVSSEGIGGHPP